MIFSKQTHSIYFYYQGKNSIPVIETIINALNAKHNTSPSITLFMNDLPTNNWEVVEKTIQPVTQNHSNLKIEYSKQTFFTQSLSSSSVTFGFSSTAMHWLSKVPSKIKDHVTPKHGKYQGTFIFHFMVEFGLTFFYALIF